YAPVARSPRDVSFQLLEPGIRAGIARSPPVAARRQRAARAHLGSVGHRGPLELAGAEEAVEEDTQPMLDHRELIRSPVRRRESGRPLAAIRIAPGLMRQECHLAGSESISADPVEMKILELERPDGGLAALHLLP